MKYIKLFENNEGESIVSNGSHAHVKYLSSDELEKSTKIFEDLLELLLYPFIDKDYDVKFETAHGSKISINYSDYLHKTTNWHIFINGFHIRGYFITIKITINDFNPILLSSIIKDDYEQFLERLPGMWTHECTDIKLSTKDYMMIGAKMFISIELDAR